MSDFPWDDYMQTGDWITFTNIGDGVVGIIKAIRVGKDFNGNPCPELIIEVDSGEEKTLTAGQVLLKQALAELRPGVGDKVRIVYSGIGEARPGKAPAKQFTVEVKTGPFELQNAAVGHQDEEAPF
jgi:Uma2 family endonuclease